MDNRICPDIQPTGKKFKEIFDVPLMKFVDEMLFSITHQFHFDIIKFDDWLQNKHGYETEKDGSIKDFVAKKWGDKACELLVWVNKQ